MSTQQSLHNLPDTLVRRLAKEFGSPLYVFDESKIRQQCRALKSVITYPKTTIRFACKALTLKAVLQIIRSEGISLDASSRNEVQRGLRAGFAPREILYTGESSARDLFEELLKLGVRLNCSSIDQLRLIGSIAPGTAVSIRFNPGEGHGANNKVNTGGPCSKHGVYFSQISEVKAVLSEYKLRLAGVHTHIGSGTDLEHWLRISNLTFGIAKQFPGLEFIDLGGGLPVVYNPATDTQMPLETWGARLSETFSKFSLEYGSPVELQLEPGRFFVAESGFLLGEIQNLKETPGYKYALVDTGFNHNPRPAMYGSFHHIHFVPREERPVGKVQQYVVAGNLCESGDVFTVTGDGDLAPRSFPELRLGDLMVMGNIGAYSHSMKSDYNSMNFPASVLLRTDGSVAVIERRGTLEDVVAREVDLPSLK